VIILGIHDGHCASACVVVDGKPVSLVAEERFTRLKNDHGYPRHSIDYCLREAGLSPSDIDQVAFSTTRQNALTLKTKALSTFTSDDWLRLHGEYWRPLLYEGRDDRDAMLAIYNQPRLQGQSHFYDFSAIGAGFDPAKDGGSMHAIRLEGVKRHLGIDADKVRFYDHHACHAYYGLFGSPVRADNTLVYTLDGGGDDTVSTLWRFAGGKVEELARSNESGVARIYRAITLLLGMKMGEHEYKVMGLAPYATDREAEKSWRIFDGMMEIREDLIRYAPGRKPTDLYFFFLEAFAAHRFDGISAAVQRMAEESVTAWFRATLAKYGSRNAVFSGGVAMNVKLNKLIAESGLVDDFYVCPSPGDDTLCVGACYMAECAASPGAWEHILPITDPYLGPAYGAADIRRAIDAGGVAGEFTVEEGVDASRTAEFLAEGKVVARCSGRMEYGARALGNRSLLADPRNAETVEKINHQIKYRDFWMPFAPVVLAERAADYLTLEQAARRSPYMMVASDTTPLGAKELAAATHRADRTARPQVLQRQHNPGYYDVVKAFERRTGTGSLINTSFNLHGEPIVCTPEDAIGTFRRSELDVLLMDDVAVSRT
jgi:carbamoyltransferase